MNTLGWGFLPGSDGKESACNARDPGLVPGLGRSAGGGHGNPLQYSCLENPWTEEAAGLLGHMWTACGPWDHTELDMTE